MNLHLQEKILLHFNPARCTIVAKLETQIQTINITEVKKYEYLLFVDLKYFFILDFF